MITRDRRLYRQMIDCVRTRPPYVVTARSSSWSPWRGPRHIITSACPRRRQTMKTNRGCCAVVTHDASSLAGRAQFISFLPTIHLAHSPARNAVHSAARPSSRLLYCALYEPAQLAPFHHPAVCLSVCLSVFRLQNNKRVYALFRHVYS